MVVKDAHERVVLDDDIGRAGSAATRPSVAHMETINSTGAVVIVTLLSVRVTRRCLPHRGG